MTILGLETSTAVCSVGLFREGKPDLEESIQESHIHSEKLLTLVQRVAQAGEVDLTQLDAVAVSIGPGSFTGLRIGLSAAKGLAYALGKPLLAVSTFRSVAAAAGEQYPEADEFLILIDAKRDEWYAARYRVADGIISEIDAVHIVRTEDAASLVSRVPSEVVLTDRVDELGRMLGSAVIVRDVHPSCRGAVVAREGSRKLLANEVVNAQELEPLYLKDFVVRSVGSAS